MTKDEGFKLLKIQTCILRVNLHCGGCKHKVKKLLQKIDGVYQVNIDAEQQKVTVSGSVDSASLIKKLVRAGKHAEIWSDKSNGTPNQSQNQNQKISCMKDVKKNKTQKQVLHKGLESLKNQQKFPPFISEEDDEYPHADDDDREEELRLQTPKANQSTFLKQHNNAKNSNNNNNNINENPINGGNRNGKKGNLNQNSGVKMSNNNNGGGAEGMNLGEGKRVNDISSIMNNLAGFGSGGGSDGDLGIRGSLANLGGFQIPQRNTVLGSGGALPSGGLPLTTGGYNPSSQASVIMDMNDGGQQQLHNNSAAASMLMNLQNTSDMQHQQPQMMYNRSSVIPPATGYFYQYNPAPYTYNEHPHYHYTSGGGGDHNSATYMFNDKNTSSCSLM